MLLLLDIINADKRVDAHVKGGSLRGMVIKMRRGGKKRTWSTRRATRRVSSRVAADSHPVEASRTPKRLNGVTHAARCLLARSLARSVVGHRANSSIALRYDLHSVMTRLVVVAPRPSSVTTLRVDGSMLSRTPTNPGLTRGKSELNEARTANP